MAKTWYATVAETGDLASDVIYQKIKLNTDTAFKAVRIWVIKYGSPTLTGLKLHLKSKNGTTPGVLIAESTNSYTAAQISTADYAIQEIYFEFSGVPFDGDDEYFLVARATSYTFDDNNHIAFVKAIDPVYETDAVISATTIPNLPYYISMVGATL